MHICEKSIHRSIYQVVEASGDGDSLDDAQIFADGLTKPPSGPETGFQGTALMGGGGGGSARRPSPPLPASASSGGGVGVGARGTIDVEAEIAAATAQSLVVGGGGGDGDGAGAGAGEPLAFLECPACTLNNDPTAERCRVCGAVFP